MLLRKAVRLLITLCSFAFAGCNACNETLRAENGGFHSPKYPQNYPDVQYCYWSITVNLSQQVHLIFRNFSLKAENNTDNVRVYDGEDTTGEVLGVFYGGHPPPKEGIYSSSNHLFVIFKSDSSGSYSGFQTSYEAVNCCAACPQKTTTGECCSIPFKYKGVKYNSCAEVDHHRPWCSLDPVYTNRWGNCPVCPQKTTTGKCCSIPFEYEGVTYHSCTKFDHHSFWCSLDPVFNNRWGNCLFCRQKTTAGACCSIPFRYKGVTYNSCTNVDHHSSWCSLDPVYNNRWGNCQNCSQKTTTGLCCSIPFKYKGVTYNSCTNVDHHSSWCSLDPVYNDRWGNCPVCPQKITTGECCSIPFKYKGVKYNSCTNVDHHRPWCSLDPVYTNRWGNCPVCPQTTTTGECCSIPFKYKGVKYNSCTEVDHHRPWCSLDPVYNNRWGNCQVRVISNGTEIPTVESKRGASQQGKGSNVAAIVGPVLACIFAAALLLVGLFYWRRRRAKKGDMSTVLYQRSASELSVDVKENDNDRTSCPPPMSIEIPCYNMSEDALNMCSEVQAPEKNETKPNMENEATNPLYETTA